MSTPTPVTSGAAPAGSSGSVRLGGSRTVDDDAESVAATVRALPGVADLYSGGIAPLATYLPGRRVTGVRFDEASVQVAVVVADGSSAPSAAGQVRAALSEMAAGRRIDVHVGDVRLPGDEEQDDAPPALPPSPRDPGGTAAPSPTALPAAGHPTS